jgi:hypothetical protein
MTSLGFENYAEALKIYLTKYREVRRPFPRAPRFHPPRRRQVTAARSISNAAKAQQARGDQNTNRPGSGYEPAGGQAPAGTAGTPATTNTANVSNPSLAAFAPQTNPSSNHLLAGQLEHPEQDQNPYGSVYPPGDPHNGAGDEPY